MGGLVQKLGQAIMQYHRSVSVLFLKYHAVINMNICIVYIDN